MISLGVYSGPMWGDMIVINVVGCLCVGVDWERFSLPHLDDMMFTDIHTYIHIYTYMYIYIHTYIYVCIYIHTVKFQYTSALFTI
jgi:hypothetical protein